MQKDPIRFTPGYEGTHSLPRYEEEGVLARRMGKRRVPPVHLTMEQREAWLCEWDLRREKANAEE